MVVGLLAETGLVFLVLRRVRQGADVDFRIAAQTGLDLLTFAGLAGFAGTPCDDLALLELTEKGWRQAEEVAANWKREPSLIVTSGRQPCPRLERRR